MNRSGNKRSNRRHRPSASSRSTGQQTIDLSIAVADYAQPGFPGRECDYERKPAQQRLGVGGQTGQAHSLTLLAASPVEIQAGWRLHVTLEYASQLPEQTLGRFRISTTGDPRARDAAHTPPAILAILQTPVARRTPDQASTLTQYYSTIAPELEPTRKQIAELQRRLAEMKPATVPIMRELANAQRRITRIQHRGNFLDVGDEVKPGIASGVSAAARRGTSKPPGPCPLAGGRSQSAHRSRDRQSLLGADIRNRDRDHQRRVRFAGRSAHASRAIGLAGHGIGPHALGHEGVCAIARHVGRLSAVVARDVRTGTSATRTIVCWPAARGSVCRPKWFATRRWRSAVCLSRQNVRSAGQASAAIVGPERRVRRSRRLANQPGRATVIAGPFIRPGGVRAPIPRWPRSTPRIAKSAPFAAVRTNTPLQALVTLNDPVYVEAAQALARRVMAEAPVVGAGTPTGLVTQRVQLAFRLCLARPPQRRRPPGLSPSYEHKRREIMRAASEAAARWPAIR